MNSPIGTCLDDAADVTAILSRLNEKSVFPLSALLELTHQCNLKCPHCYIPDQSLCQALSTDEIDRVLESLAANGTLFLTLSGGEPTVRDDFYHILQKAIDLRFAVILKTNGSLLCSEDVHRLHQMGLLRLHVSLYHLDAQAHDRFVGLPGAFKKATEALRVFHDAGGFVRVSTILMDWNIDVAARLEQWYERQGWEYSFDIRVEPCLDGNTKSQRYSASADALIKGIRTVAQLKKSVSLPTNRPLPSQKVCGIGTSSLVVQPNGNVIPCVGAAGVVLGNVRNFAIHDIWNNSKKLEKLQRICWGDSPKCLTCDDLEYCFRCPVTALHEHGDAGQPAKLDCMLARARHQARLALDAEDG